MLINNDAQSSQAAHRQRRHAADEKARNDRIATDAADREGVARQAGEAPTREEVAHFRSLMGAQGRDERPLDNGKPTLRDARAPAGDTSKFAGELAALSTAERFRAMMQQAFAAVGERGGDVAHDAAPDDGKAPSSQETHAPVRADGKEAAKTGAQDRAAQAAEARSAASDEARVPERGAEANASSGKAASSASDEAAGPNGKRNVEAKPKSGDGEAESAQQAARKAADGEAQIGQAARVAHGDDDADDGEGVGAALAQGGSGGMPTPMAADMPMPQQPQRMPDAPQQAAAASASLAPALSELVQKHVKQMLVSDPRSLRGRSREVLLRMQNDVLPGTDLWLTQTDSGWQLRADVRSRDAYDTLLANQDELVQRFADGALGTLTIEPVYHG